MAPDVVQISDGGGKISAARRPILGREDVARFALGIARNVDFTVEFASYNGLPAVRFLSGGALDWVLAVEIHDGLITGLYGIRNPDKLDRAETTCPLTRGGHTPWKP